MNINERTKYIRERLGYPQESFSRKIGSSTGMVPKVEDGGDPTYQYLKNILNIFPVNPQWLYTGDGDPFLTKSLKKYLYQPSTSQIKANKSIDPKVALRFREVRRMMNMNQAFYGNELGVTRDIVNSIENCRQSVPIYVVRALYDRYNISPNWLILGRGQTRISHDRIQE